MTTDTKKILVVDDDADARLLMRSALRKSGFEVSVANSGEDALLQFRNGSFDMVMLDVEMPGMDGHQVCAILRAEAGDLLPIVMVTGMDNVQSVDKAYHAGATDFIAKPINWGLIGHRVRYLLRGQQALLDLRAANARNEAIIRAIPDLLFELDFNGRYIDYHSPHEALPGAPPVNFIGKTVDEVLPFQAAQVCMAALQAAHQNGSSIGKQFEVTLSHSTHWFELSVARKDASSGIPHFIVLARDITERKEAEHRILRLALFDSLTGLPNRRAFLERVEREIRRAEQGHYMLGLLFLDLDGFKNVNDTLGHNAGDMILQLAAERLTRCLRPSDVTARPNSLPHIESEVEIARLGGDEFTALILDIKNPDDLLQIGNRIHTQMRKPFVLDEHNTVMMTTSIGIALYPDNGTDPVALLKHADTAMYHAKDSGRDNCQFYDLKMTARAMQRMEVKTNLRLALERKEFHLVYQPQFDTNTGRFCAVEALLRWQHPTQGSISPLDFIPIAEESGLIIPIGQWILHTACADAMRWQQTCPPFRIAVNLSPIQFKDATLISMIDEALRDTNLPASLLDVEITESTAMTDITTTMNTLHAIRERGIKIAIDDFGTGHSSLSYLQRMPLSCLKIDRSFIRGLPTDTNSKAIVRAVLAMANSLDLAVVAEGVETLEQAQTLKSMRCNYLQGYFFSKPVAAEHIPELMLRKIEL